LWSSHGVTPYRSAPLRRLFVFMLAETFGRSSIRTLPDG
jgi:hypothetical protein